MGGRETPKPGLIVVLGPTGVGKTEMAMELAETWDGEIINADSMQVYRYMDIGTAKPTVDQRRRIPHHLLDVVDPDEPFDVSRYIEMAHGVVARLQRRGKRIFVVGGTGLYIRALLKGLIDGAGADDALRQELKDEMNLYGKEHLYRKLKVRDDRAAARIHPNDGVRIIRALEVLELTGRSIVEHQAEHGFRDAPYDTLRIGLSMERERLNNRIDQRTDRMVAAGFVAEVQRLLDMGYGETLKAMQSLGYRHIMSFLAGRHSLEEAVGLIKRDTRHYAKRQMTWFAADPEIVWLGSDDVEGAAKRIERFLGQTKG